MFHGSNLRTHKSTMQIYSPGDDNTSELLGQIAFQLNINVKRLFNVSVFVADKHLDYFAPKFHLALRKRLLEAQNILQCTRLAFQLGCTRIQASASYSFDLTFSDQQTVLEAWRPVQYIPLTPDMAAVLTNDPLAPIRHCRGAFENVRQAVDDLHFDTTQYGKGRGQGRGRGADNSQRQKGKGRGRSSGRSDDHPPGK